MQVKLIIKCNWAHGMLCTSPGGLVLGRVEETSINDGIRVVCHATYYDLYEDSEIHKQFKTEDEACEWIEKKVGVVCEQEVTK